MGAKIITPTVIKIAPFIKDCDCKIVIIPAIIIRMGIPQTIIFTLKLK